MEIENLAGKWPNVAINPATGKTYEAEHMDNGISVQKCLNDTREQLEADVYDGWLDDFSRGKVFELLDRQAAITEYELNKERDELLCERNIAIGRASYMESVATEELAKLLGENETIEVYDDKIHGKRRLVTGTQRKLEKQIDELTAERDKLKRRLENQAAYIASVENDLCRCKSQLVRDGKDIDELTAERDKLQDDIQYFRKVCQTQAGSFAAIENENTALRSRLNRIRELAERLQDA